MRKVKLTIIESECRCHLYKNGETFIVGDVCPPICHEFWQQIYPYVYALLNGGVLDYRNGKAKEFYAVCPDSGRVKIHGEVIEE